MAWPGSILENNQGEPHLKKEEPMATIRVGVQLAPQHTTYAAYVQAVRQVEALGVDTIWNWDHFFPPWDDEQQPDEPSNPQQGYHFEAWTLLTAMTMVTQRVEVGCLVTCNSYRNPALLANMAKTVDHISAGRLILGLGAGWNEKEHNEYGYRFGTARERLNALEETLQIVRQRWATELPPPTRTIPILIGGGGERVTLKLTAQYADMWNGGRSPEIYKHKCEVLDQWCSTVGRDPKAIERTLNIYGNPTPAIYDEYVRAGAQHIILNLGAPWDMTPVEQLVRWRDAR
jgi:probable F420-dependent oxidoreductase